MMPPRWAKFAILDCVPVILLYMLKAGILSTSQFAGIGAKI